jgi:hypothetical protein
LRLEEAMLLPLKMEGKTMRKGNSRNWKSKKPASSLKPPKGKQCNSASRILR